MSAREKKSLWQILFVSGEGFIWLTGGALAASLLMVAFMICLILYNGLGFFWPDQLVELKLKDGRTLLCVEMEHQVFIDPMISETEKLSRVKVKQANRDLYDLDFAWIREMDITSRSEPTEAMVVERLEWGNFHGIPKELRDGDKVLATGPAETAAKFDELMPQTTKIRGQIHHLARNEIGKVSHELKNIRVKLKRLQVADITSGPKVDALNAEAEGLEEQNAIITEQMAELKKKQTYTLVMSAPDGTEKPIPLSAIVYGFQPNKMSFLSKCGHYIHKVYEFIFDDPREANTEGGVFPAIFGTVMMVFIMSIIVTPFGVLAAFYLREYAAQGTFVSIVRIAVNNLAGVPSIVFGVFGVGFFIYFVGGSLDEMFWPKTLYEEATFGGGGILWAALTLALLTVPVVIVATEEGLAAIPPSMREGSLALGATKFETMKSVVLPAVMPSILTGLILAMARAAGEVAPLMITGVVKLAPSLPLDGYFPYVHLERKFMHLGFHIYDVGFQSPNVDAARPMVYTTTFLLLIIVLMLNVGAVMIRNKLRKKFSTASAAI